MKLLCAVVDPPPDANREGRNLTGWRTGTEEPASLAAPRQARPKGSYLTRKTKAAIIAWTARPAACASVCSGTPIPYLFQDAASFRQWTRGVKRWRRRIPTRGTVQSVPAPVAGAPEPSILMHNPFRLSASAGCSDRHSIGQRGQPGNEERDRKLSHVDRKSGASQGGMDLRATCEKLAVLSPGGFGRGTPRRRVDVARCMHALTPRASACRSARLALCFCVFNLDQTGHLSDQWAPVRDDLDNHRCRNRKNRLWRMSQCQKRR